MSRVRRAHYGAGMGVALIVAALTVTVVGGWPRVQSLFVGVAAVLSTLLVLKILSVAVIIGIRSVL